LNTLEDDPHLAAVQFRQEGLKRTIAPQQRIDGEMVDRLVANDGR